jgi:hypothetical protein
MIGYTSFLVGRIAGSSCGGWEGKLRSEGVSEKRGKECVMNNEERTRRDGRNV